DEHRFRKMNNSVHLPPESVFIMNRNGCSSSIGIGVQHGSEYAYRTDTQIKVMDDQK
ncbi:MAG: hypothetical protein ACI8VC_002978, partial [Candidatus Endobugula sp.]